MASMAELTPPPAALHHREGGSREVPGDSGTLRWGQSRSEALAGPEVTGHRQGARHVWGCWEGWGNVVHRAPGGIPD